MQEAIIAELLEGLKTAFNAEWATGTHCRQTIDGQTRVYDLCGLVEVYAWIEAALTDGTPLTRKQITAARRAIANTQWHETRRRKRAGGI